MNKKTYNYFKEREQKHQAEKIKDDEKFSKVLEKEYQRTLREIDNRINWWIGKFADDNVISVEQAKKIVAEADINELKEKAKEYVKNKDLSTRANKEMRIYNLKMKIARDELLQKYIDLELAKLGTKEERLLEDRIFNDSIEELERQSGILGKHLISSNTMQTIAQQIVNDSHTTAHFSDYIWTNIKELRNDLQNGLNRSILRGQNPNAWKKDLYKHFRGRTQKAEFYSRRLAVTETAIAQTKAGLISAKENGYDKVIVITELGACKDCKPHDGKIVNIDEAKMGNNVPIWHPFCRCTVAAYYEYEDNIPNPDDLFGKSNELNNISKGQVARDKDWTNIDKSDKIEERTTENKKVDYKPLNDVAIDKYQSKSNDVYANLSKTERESLGEYTQGGYESINTALGSGIESHYAKSLNSSIDKFTVDSDIITYRGTNEKYYKGYKTGDVFEGKVFYSTSVKQDWAKAFADDMTKYSDDGSKGVLLEIKIPKGSKALYIGGNTDYDLNEYELLLSNKTKYKVEKIEDGKISLEMIL